MSADPEATSAALATAVRSAITTQSLRDALTEAQAQRLRARHSRDIADLPDRSSALEFVARQLRHEIITRFVERGLHEVTDWDQDAMDVTSPTAEDTAEAEAACSSSRLSGPALTTLTFQDPGDDPLPMPAAEVQVHRSTASEVHLGCPQCRRPLDVKARLGLSHRATPKEDMAGKHAYCAVLRNGMQDSFLQAVALGESLIRSGCRKDRVLLHCPEVPKPYLEVLGRYWALQRFPFWPRLLGRSPNPRWSSQDNGSSDSIGAARLLALSLIGYCKVLVVDLGFVVCESLDALFELQCPAAALMMRAESKTPQLNSTGSHEDWASGELTGASATVDAGTCGVDVSMMLLQPSLEALRRMTAEVGSDICAWPSRSSLPRGPEGDGLLGEYVQRFYRAFFRGSWSEIPADYAPRGVSAMASPGRATASRCVQQRSGREYLERVRAEAVPEEEAQGEPSLMPMQLLVSELRQVEKNRCIGCGIHDAEGTSDPIDLRWRCRFCWEAMLLDGVLQAGCNTPLSSDETEQLEKALGPCYLGSGSGRQRWTWSYGWIEFRPKGVLWTKEAGVGAWQLLDQTENSKTQIAVHLRSGGRSNDRYVGDRSEVRHVLQLWNGPSMGGRLELEEIRREVSKPLGFARSAHMEYKIRSRPLQEARAAAAASKSAIATRSDTTTNGKGEALGSKTFATGQSTSQQTPVESDGKGVQMDPGKRTEPDSHAERQMGNPGEVDKAKNGTAAGKASAQATNGIVEVNKAATGAGKPKSEVKKSLSYLLQK